MRSVGVDVPLREGEGEGRRPLVVFGGCGEDREFLDVVEGSRKRLWWEEDLRWEVEVGLAIVVLRPKEADSGAEGGGGREERSEEAGRMEDRQRKHSPVP